MGRVRVVVGLVVLGWGLACGGLPVGTDQAIPDPVDTLDPAPTQPEPVAEPAPVEEPEPTVEEPAPAEPEEPTETPSPSPAPAPSPVPAPTPTPAPSPTPAPNPTPSPAPAPSPSPAPSAASGIGRVTVEGDAKVVLIDARGAKLAVPGEVPVGIYVIEARFETAEPVRTGKVRVVPEGTVIRCNPKMGICRGAGT